MGKIIRNGIEYAGDGGGGVTTTRFVKDASDPNYGWIQYKDENGDWVNWECVNETKKYLIHGGVMSDICSFTAYGDTGQTITKGDKGIVFTKPNNSTHGYFDTDFLYDMSKYSKLVFVVSEFNSVYGTYMALSKTIGSTNVTSQKLFDAVGTHEIDLTSVNDKCCIMLCMPNNGARSVTITDMYLE